jgi:hypothetical protein
MDNGFTLHASLCGIELFVYIDVFYLNLISLHCVTICCLFLDRCGVVKINWLVSKFSFVYKNGHRCIEQKNKTILTTFEFASTCWIS